MKINIIKSIENTKRRNQKKNRTRKTGKQDNFKKDENTLNNG